MNPNAYPATNVPSAEPAGPQRRRPVTPFAARAVRGCLRAALLACGLVPFAPRAAGADEVDEATLQRALDRTVRVFPGFNVSLRSGMFWHYL